MVFADRTHAGTLLAEKLLDKIEKPAVLLAIPRGGVIVARAIAESCHLPLDLVVPRKIGAPLQPEVAIGAVAQDGSTWLNQQLIRRAHIEQCYINEQIDRATAEIKRRMRLYRGSDRYPDYHNYQAIVVDDGIATGYTVLAACTFIRRSLQPRRLLLAVPVLPAEMVPVLQEQVDELVYLAAPEEFYAVGQFYGDFRQVGDDEVKDALHL
ncbi:MAG: phosphoribosyltransferase [Desulfurispora sp.]|uniref:phosphoribosyltransferase n=1 Tax=Desulfurispora sp. TaxID=3014275 RepID=UPI004048EB72